MHRLATHPLQRIGVLLALIATADCTCGRLGEPCTPGEVRICPCLDGQSSLQVCHSDGGSFSDCACELPREPSIDLSTSPATAVIGFDTMAPGDEVVRPLEVINAGTDALRYSARSFTTEDALADQLTFDIGATTDATCTKIDELIYGPDRLGSASGQRLFGDPSPGGQIGDRILAGESREILCLHVRLPLDTGNAFQGLTTTMALQLNAEAIDDE